VPGCDGKVKDIYKSKELWRGPESIYTLEKGLCVAHDTGCADEVILALKGGGRNCRRGASGLLYRFGFLSLRDCIIPRLELSNRSCAGAYPVASMLRHRLAT
jgi:hypothetical protein